MTDKAFGPENTEPARHPIIVVMGVSGCGKSTVAKALAGHLGAYFKDGDELHPAANIAKMSSGQPLNDTDRQPWLKQVRDHAAAQSALQPVVIACSALNRRYRHILDAAGNVFYVYLDGSPELIAQRMQARSGHFFSVELLDSQFRALEDPRGEPNVVSVSIEPEPAIVAEHAASVLHAHHGFAAAMAAATGRSPGHTPTENQDMSNTDKADIALIGLAVMGQNLILNMNDHGYRVVAYNRTRVRTDEFMAGPATGTQVVPAHTLEALVEQLASPRKVMLMVRAGEAVDATIEALLPWLDKGDVIIDGGNSNFTDTQRRCDSLAKVGILYVGTGVSGGEEGARTGPSIMPGGHAAAWPLIKPMFQSIAAKTDAGEPCCDWVGDGGAGHFVKMVHNGIEYGDMQLICETYHYMKNRLGMDNPAMHRCFADWNRGELNSYLIEITADILAYQENGEYVLDTILDQAGQKGTGKWTGINALELGTPLTMIAEAVFARMLSAVKDERVQASKVLHGPTGTKATNQPVDPAQLHALGKALYAAKIVSYAQGYMLMRAAAGEYGWKLNFGGIAQMWRGGCIIRSAFLDDIRNAYQKDSQLQNLLLDDFFREQIETADSDWRQTICQGVMHGIPMPAMASALAFFDGYRTARLPANLLQAQRDYFGAHTYRKLDGDNEAHHTDWTGHGGATSSSTYNA